jgi:1-acyl-sn-glycerol-3-phosphate acyltransferase
MKEHYLYSRPFFAFIRYTTRVIAFWYFRFETRGLENIPREGGVLVVSNHQSAVDPPMVGCKFRRSLNVLAKAELCRYPILGRFMRYIGSIPFRRQGVDREAMAKIVDLLRGGGLVILFPEGTRTHDGKLGKAGPMTGMMAAQAGVPCVPAYIDGAFRAFPRTRSYPLPRKITITYGKPFDLPPRPEGVKNRVYYQLCADEMMRKIAELAPESTLKST